MEVVLKKGVYPQIIHFNGISINPSAPKLGKFRSRRHEVLSASDDGASGDSRDVDPQRPGFGPGSLHYRFARLLLIAIHTPNSHG